jgi:hypothetical protein
MGAGMKLRKRSILVVNCVTFFPFSWEPLSLVIHRVRFPKTKLQKSTLAFIGGRDDQLRKRSILVVNWVTSKVVFPFSWAPPLLLLLHIFSLLLTCTTTIISLEPRALNAEFQHFILSCSISSWDFIKCLYFADTTHSSRRWGVKGGPKTGWRQGYFTDNSINASPIFFSFLCFAAASSSACWWWYYLLIIIIIIIILEFCNTFSSLAKNN